VFDVENKAIYEDKTIINPKEIEDLLTFQEDSDVLQKSNISNLPKICHNTYEIGQFNKLLATTCYAIKNPRKFNGPDQIYRLSNHLDLKGITENIEQYLRISKKLLKEARKEYDSKLDDPKYSQEIIISIYNRKFSKINNNLENYLSEIENTETRKFIKQAEYTFSNMLPYINDDKEIRKDLGSKNLFYMQNQEFSKIGYKISQFIRSVGKYVEVYKKIKNNASKKDIAFGIGEFNKESMPFPALSN